MKKIIINKNREYAIELLRIISMMMIISLHFCSYGQAANVSIELSLSNFARRILMSICGISVNCYILTSGYFLINFKFKIRKLLKLVAEVFFYSATIYLIMVILSVHNFSVKEFLCSLFPTLTREYWFITSYVGVYIISPILRDFVKILNKSKHRKCVVIGFAMFVVYYNLFFFCDNLNFGGSTGIVWFIYLYICGSYIFKYDKSFLSSNVKKYIISMLVALASQVPFLLIYLITNKRIFLVGANIFDSVYNSIFVFISSLCFFKIFTSWKWNPKSEYVKNIIIFLSSGSLAVYLIHDNKYMRELIWSNISFNPNNPIEFIIYWVITIIIIYLLCVNIDCVRRYCINKLVKIIKNYKIIKDIDIEEKAKKIYLIIIKKVTEMLG